MKGGKKRERNINVWLPLTCPPYWGPGPQPRHVPWLGIKSETLWFAGQHSIHWATPPRAEESFLKKTLMWIWAHRLKCWCFLSHIWGNSELGYSNYDSFPKWFHTFYYENMLFHYYFILLKIIFLILSVFFLSPADEVTLQCSYHHCFWNNAREISHTLFVK